MTDAQGASGQGEPRGLPPLVTPPDHAELYINAGAAETDNILRTQDAQSQTLAIVGANFDVSRTGKRLDADLKGDFSYIDFLQNAFDKQLLGRFDGLVGWAVLPERFRWVVEDHYGQSQLDPFAAVTPTNLEDINVVSTGPDVVLHPGDSWFTRLGARYSYASYETSPFDNRRLTGDLGVGRDLSHRSSVSLNADWQKVNFNNTTVNSDDNRRRFYGRYSIVGARTGLTFDVGVSQTQDGPAISTTTPVPQATSGRPGRPIQIKPAPGNAQQWKSTPFARLELIRALSSSSLLTVTAGRQYTDTSDNFAGLQGGAAGKITIAPVSGTSESYLDQYGVVTWRFQHPRTEVAVTATWDRQSYRVNTLLSVERINGEIRLIRRLTSRFSAELSGSAGRERYFEDGFSDENYLGSFSINYQVGPRLQFKTRYDHDSRIATAGGGGFVENRLTLSVEYRVLPWNGLKTSY
jgi:hypothetical protein